MPLIIYKISRGTMSTLLPSLSEQATEALQKYLSGNKLSVQQVTQLASKLKSVSPTTLEAILLSGGALVAAGANPFTQFVHESLKGGEMHHTPINDKFNFKIVGNKIVPGKQKPTTPPPTPTKPAKPTIKDPIKDTMNQLLQILRSASTQVKSDERLSGDQIVKIKNQITQLKKAGVGVKTLSEAIRSRMGGIIPDSVAEGVVDVIDFVYPKGGKIGTTETPIPIVGTSTKTKPKTKGKPEDEEPKPPKPPRLPEDPKPRIPRTSTPEVVDPKPHIGIKGRYRPRFKRHNNTHNLKPGEDRDDLFGDDIDEHEIALLELNEQLNKFGAFNHKDTPGRRAELMDDALKFFGQTETYQTGADHRGFFFHPDYGFVPQTIDEFGNDINPFVYQGVDVRSKLGEDLSHTKTMVSSSNTPMY